MPAQHRADLADGALAPDFKTIVDFRKDNGRDRAIREVCRTFVALCRQLDLLSETSVAINGSKLKAVNVRDKNFAEAKVKRRHERIDDPALLTRSPGLSLRHGVVGEPLPA